VPPGDLRRAAAGIIHAVISGDRGLFRETVRWIG